MLQRHRQSIGTDRRQQHADYTTRSRAGWGIDEYSPQERIERVHQRLLEQATNGRLTFSGDDIVRAR